MWVSPNHPNPPQAAAPPAESGQRLATFPRGEGVELRLSLAEFNGHPFLSLRVWERDQAGKWWPCKGKGVSVRLSECGPIADVLADLANDGPPPPPPPPADDRPQYVPPKTKRPEPRDMTKAHPPWEPDPNGGAFDEFA